MAKNTPLAPRVLYCYAHVFVLFFVRCEVQLQTDSYAFRTPTRPVHPHHPPPSTHARTHAPASIAVTAPLLPSRCMLRTMQLPQSISVTSSPSDTAAASAWSIHSSCSPGEKGAVVKFLSAAQSIRVTSSPSDTAATSAWSMHISCGRGGGRGQVLRVWKGGGANTWSIHISCGVGVGGGVGVGLGAEHVVILHAAKCASGKREFMLLMHHSYRGGGLDGYRGWV